MPKRDVELTKRMHFMHKDSFVGQRMHPGTNHPCIYRRGKDVGPARLVIYERDKGRCQYCGVFADWDSGEIHHKEGGLGLQRCSCPENLAWACAPCHRKQHPQVQWTRRIA